MRHQIITQAGDLAVVLRYLSGEYRTRGPARIVTWTLVALFLGGAIWVALDDSEEGLGIAAVLLVIAGVMLDQATVKYVFSTDAIERRSPIPFLSRSVPVIHVHEGYLIIDKGLTLELVPVEGRKLVIPLEGDMRKDFVRLYTELGEDPYETPILNPRWRVAIYGFLALLFIALLIIMVILARKGLVTW